jgi:hypothetical protein
LKLAIEQAMRFGRTDDFHREADDSMIIGHGQMLLIEGRDINF